ncbi:hypothetical protein CB0940_03361 [Cercospora beticola]|uniref:F-box domain-containing protein n=1 Tax=Cercospora beticola TaxID=122368 RepID=A0A2G5I3K8_CERBT|nr:hypothetical protein CB0940_03361 [Cercospora beticola]PIA99404.1 hypothetical protein CB0940_03361 [Cercospora beticola]WPB00537.1 hypothetical protein RHO25_005157 [Cercospora beticola]CAK1361245.1 unnamed protein product [Cercospora beticola]
MANTHSGQDAATSSTSSNTTQPSFDNRFPPSNPYIAFQLAFMDKQGGKARFAHPFLTFDTTMPHTIRKVLRNRYFMHLLQNIFSRLSRRQLLVIERVCKFWQEVLIYYSPNLEEWLFYSAVEKRTVCVFETNEQKNVPVPSTPSSAFSDYEFETLRLVDRISGTVGPLCVLREKENGKEGKMFYGVETKQNPYLLRPIKYTPNFLYSGLKFSYQIFSGTRFTIPTETLVEIRDFGLADSRMGMFLTQPPVCEVRVSVLDPFGGDGEGGMSNTKKKKEKKGEDEAVEPSVRDLVVREEEGVRLKHLIRDIGPDLVQRRFEEWTVSILVGKGSLVGGETAVFLKEMDKTEADERGLLERITDEMELD